MSSIGQPDRGAVLNDPLVSLYQWHGCYMGSLKVLVCWAKAMKYGEIL